MSRIARALACNTLEDLETLILSDRAVWNRRTIEWNAKRVPDLKEEAKAAKDKLASLELEKELHLRRLQEGGEAFDALRTQLEQTLTERNAATTGMSAAV